MYLKHYGRRKFPEHLVEVSYGQEAQRDVDGDICCLVCDRSCVLVVAGEETAG